jgi:peptidoglycan/xylan/chitin deacetylase (PgdA/CDA1 family)
MEVGPLAFLFARRVCQLEVSGDHQPGDDLDADGSRRRVAASLFCARVRGDLASSIAADGAAARRSEGRAEDAASDRGRRDPATSPPRDDAHRSDHQRVLGVMKLQRARAPCGSDVCSRRLGGARRHWAPVGLAVALLAATCTSAGPGLLRRPAAAAPAIVRGRPITATVPARSWLVSSDGAVATAGGAVPFGTAAGVSRAAVVGLAPTPTGAGYWEAALDGGVFAFGDAGFYGSAVGLSRAPVIGLAPTPSGHGYWLASLDGGVFSFGDARFYGSRAGAARSPVVALAATSSGGGYWLASLDGGVFSFGDARFYGSAAGVRHAPVVGAAATPSGHGYWLVASDGGVLTFGDAGFYGSVAAESPVPVVGLVPTPAGAGYWLVRSDGTTSAFGDASPLPGGRAPTAPAIGLARPGGPPAMGGWFVVSGSPGTPVAALTFDDGPDPSHTPSLLDELARLGVPATFFIIGRNGAAYSDLVREEARLGNSVQDHTWSHVPLPALSAGAFAFQVGTTQALLAGLTGVAPRCLRPPDGIHTAFTDALTAQRGLHLALWNVDPRDWTGISAAEIVGRVLAQLQPVSVIELHDRTAIVAALPALVAALRARGYRFATICQTGGATPGSPL